MATKLIRPAAVDGADQLNVSATSAEVFNRASEAAVRALRSWRDDPLTKDSPLMSDEQAVRAAIFAVSAAWEHFVVAHELEMKRVSTEVHRAA